MAMSVSQAIHTSHDVLNPATEALVETVALVDLEQTDRAIDAAAAAQRT